MATPVLPYAEKMENDVQAGGDKREQHFVAGEAGIPVITL